MNPETSLKLLSPAKLNLFLHITGRLANGYHSLQTVFQLLDFGDTLSFKLRSDDKICLYPDNPEIPQQDNLIDKAARLLKNHSGFQHGVDITIEKRLPLGGGLGGGSSNAATTLLALNQLWCTQLPLETLAELGKQLGADVPVFVMGRSAWAEGIGEQLTPVSLPENWYLVIKPPCHVATAEIFSAEELTRNTTPIKIAAFLDQGGHNDCEPVVRNRYPEVAFALDWLSQFATAKLTGTGACCFAQFAQKQEAQAVLDCLPKNLSGFIARGVNVSSTHATLGLSV